MGDGDDVPARVRRRDARDRLRGAIVEVHETLAVRRGFVDFGEPVAAERQACDEFLAIHALPLAEILLGEQNLMRHARRPGKSSGPDRFRSLVRALEIARIPGRSARQDFRHRLEYLAIAAIAFDVLLAVDVAAVAAHRRMTYPPPARDGDTGLVVIGHPDDPLLVSSYVR